MKNYILGFSCSILQCMHVILNTVSHLDAHNRTYCTAHTKVVARCVWCDCKECSSCICATDKPAFTGELGDLYSADVACKQGCTRLSPSHTHTHTHTHMHGHIHAHRHTSKMDASTLCAKAVFHTKYNPYCRGTEHCNK